MSDSKNKSSILKKIFISLIYILPFAFALLAYCNYKIGDDNLDLWEAVYSSLSLYFANCCHNPNSENATAFNVIIHICRIWAPIMTLSGILLIVKNFVVNAVLRVRYFLAWKNAKAVYCDADDIAAMNYCGENKNTFYDRRGSQLEKISFPCSSTHIIMFENDMKNLGFYERYSKKLKGENIRIRLENIHPRAIRHMLSTESEKTFAKPMISFFSINEIIAVQFWLNYKGLLKHIKDDFCFNIAITDFGGLGRKLLEKALLMNIVSLNQKITYHIFDNSDKAEAIFGSFETMNGDRLAFYKAETLYDREVIRRMDLIIIPDSLNTELIDYVNMTKAAKTEVYIYSPEHNNQFSDNFNLFFENKKSSDFLTGIRPFGNHKEVYTEKNIVNEYTNRTAMYLNYIYNENEKIKNTHDKKSIKARLDEIGAFYCIKDREQASKSIRKEWEKNENNARREWDKLDFFTRASNVAQADYTEFLAEILKYILVHDDIERISKAEFSEFEHIRWCRFHYLDDWECDISVNGRDSNNKKHNLLVPFDKLNSKHQKKDLYPLQLIIAKNSGLRKSLKQGDFLDI